MLPILITSKLLKDLLVQCEQKYIRSLTAVSAVFNFLQIKKTAVQDHNFVHIALKVTYLCIILK